MTTGTVGILNVGAGDTKLTFDPSNPMETARASRIVVDMIRRGYVLFVETGRDDENRPKYTRAESFDEKTAEYIIADFDPIASDNFERSLVRTGRALVTDPPTRTSETENSDDAEEHSDERTAPVEPDPPAGSPSGGRGEKAGKKKKATRTKRVPASGTSAVAVARTAGG